MNVVPFKARTRENEHVRAELIGIARARGLTDAAIAEIWADIAPRIVRIHGDHAIEMPDAFQCAERAFDEICDAVGATLNCAFLEIIDLAILLYRARHDGDRMPPSAA